MRANSISNPAVGIDRNIPSVLDDIQALVGVVEEIEELAPYAAEIATLVANLSDVTTVQEANNIINNLTVSVVETLPAGSEASAELVGTEIQLRIPEGVAGRLGENGLTPNIEFSIDAFGNLQYEVVNWSDMSGNIVSIDSEEW